MDKYILCIDQGTTGTTAGLVNQDGEFLDRLDQDFEQIYPQPGWVEHNPQTIWKTVEQTVDGLLRKNKIKGEQVVGIGITNQRETVLVWDKRTGLPVYNAIVWQCRRTTTYTEALKKKGLEKKIKAKTGLVVDPYFSASKIQWILKNAIVSKEQRPHLRAGTIDCFLLWKLTGGLKHATDVSNASRTQLMNIDKCQWDPELLKIFSIPEEYLPTIEPSSGIFGHTKGLSFLPDGIPVSGIAGDQQAALFGQACFEAGEAKCTYGTGSFILMNTGSKRVNSASGCLTTIAWQLSKKSKPVYALEGSAFICGAAVQWLRDGLGIISSSSEIEALAQQVSSSEGVEFVPALTGLGAPYWQPDARGEISGITRGTTRAHVARATLEGMALQNVDILSAMTKDLKKKLKILRVDGGASSNNLLMQIQADYLDVNIERPKNVESTSLGAAFLAGLGVGFWSDPKKIREVWKRDKAFGPKMTKKDREARKKKWHDAVKKTFP